MEERKKRRRTFNVVFDQPKLIQGVGFDKEGRLTAFGPNGEIHVPSLVKREVFYDRDNPKKPKKIVNQSPIGEEHLQLNPDSIITKFDAVYAIDTNTAIYGPDSVSVTGVVLCRPINYPTLQPMVGYSPIHCMEFRNVTCKPEVLGWVKSIEAIQRGLKAEKQTCSRIGLIVDSELGLHEAYNNRTVPLLDNFYLPANFVILYASADTKQGYVLNHLMKAADKTAKTMWKQITSDINNVINLKPVSGEHFSHYRFWTFDNTA